jgi:hypothetical protein
MTPPEQITKHHCFWEKKQYTKTRIGREFRGSITVDTPYKVQQQLHAEMEQPPMPSKPDMREFLDKLEPAPEHITMYGLHKAIQFFAEKYITTGQEKYKATSEHLLRQMGYLTMDSVNNGDR